MDAHGRKDVIIKRSLTSSKYDFEFTLPGLDNYLTATVNKKHFGSGGWIATLFDGPDGVTESHYTSPRAEEAIFQAVLHSEEIATYADENWGCSEQL